LLQHTRTCFRVVDVELGMVTDTHVEGVKIGPGNPENGAFEDTCCVRLTNTSSAALAQQFLTMPSLRQYLEGKIVGLLTHKSRHSLMRRNARP
jgi:hypothetical protein